MSANAPATLFTALPLTLALLLAVARKVQP